MQVVRCMCVHQPVLKKAVRLYCSTHCYISEPEDFGTAAGYLLTIIGEMDKP